MKHFNKALLLPMVFLLGLSGCGDNSSEIDPTSDFDNIDKNIITLTTNAFQEGGTYSEGFEDVPFRYFAHDSRYLFEFHSNIDEDPSFRVVSSRPESVTIEMDPTSVFKFDVVTHEPGDSIIMVYNSEDMMVYRNVIRVRTGFSPEDIAKAVYHYDVYTTPKEIQSFYGNYSFSLLSFDNPISGVISGTDEVETKTITLDFTLEYDKYIKEYDAYSFKANSTTSESGETTIVCVNIARCAEEIYVYYDYNGEGVLLTALTNPNR